MDILGKTIEKNKLQQILQQQETMLDNLVEYRDGLYRLSFSVGNKRTTYGNLSRDYIRVPYLQLTKLIEETRKNIKKIEDRLHYLDSDDLSKI